MDDPIEEDVITVHSALSSIRFGRGYASVAVGCIRGIPIFCIIVTIRALARSASGSVPRFRGG